MSQLSGELLFKCKDNSNYSDLDFTLFVKKGSDNTLLRIKKHLSKLSEEMLFCFVRENRVFRLNQDFKEEPSSFTFEGFKNVVSSPKCPFRLGFWFDEDLQRIYVFREFFGRIPFYYTFVDDHIIFSTQYKVLTQNPRLKNRLTLNDDIIYKYLSPHYANSAYNESTIFHEIKAILPGYLTELVSGTSHFTVNFLNNQYTNYSALDEYGASYRALLKTSVARSIKSATHVSSHLSGGLDSSSIVSMVRHLRPTERIVGLHLTQEIVKEDSKYPTNHDITYARDVARDKNIELHFLSFDLEDTDSILSAIKAYGQPPFISGVVRMRKLISVAKEQGCDLMLTGSVGDSVNGLSFDYLTELFAKRKWSKLKESIEEMANTDRYRDLGNSNNDTPLNYAKYAFVQRQLTGLLSKKDFKAIFDLLFVGGIKLKLNFLSLTRNFTNQYKHKFKTRKTDLIPLVKVNTQRKPVKLPHANCKIHVNQTVRLLEDYYELQTNSKLKIDSPYCDAALYHLCESVPKELKFFHGLGRGQLRVGMEGILTESVRLRSNKTSPSSEDKLSWFMNLIENCQDLLSVNCSIWRYVDRATFLTNVEICKNGKPTPQSLSRFTAETFRIILLSAWLKCNEL